VIFTGNSVEITNPKVVRSTVGSLFHLPVIPDKDLTGVINELRTRGLTILAADGKGEISLPKVSSLDRPTGWLFGNEAWGLDDRDAALADQIVSVPIYGQAESLNLATAAAVCLYASANALHSK
jgi:TrmH family RNA methyltransferase